MLGHTLAHYKILEKIGSGGMGDVYLAKDTKLGRNIALKVLPAELAESDERRARFEREAKAIAALNHPNIITVHSVEEADGVHFITMELVKGKTLAELLPRKGFPLQKFLDMAIPLADAVDAAHEQGIIHRDLKPGNVMVTDDGRVKVLDFGLARTEAPVKAHVDSESPTDLMTREGTLVGTLHYMSPEQADGKTLDRRSDIFSLGVIFYELLTGQRPFQGDSPATTISSVLKDDPKPVTELRPELPHDLARIVRRCLAKDAEKRFQTSKDVRNELEDLEVAMSSEQSEAPSAGPIRPNRLSIALVLMLAALAVYTFHGRPSESDRARLRLTNAIQVTGALGVEDYPVWSPDGKNLAYAATTTGDLTGGNWDILVSPLGAPEPLNRTSDHDGEDRYPAWSPDGAEIAFWSDREGGGVFVMPALAGAPRKIASAFSSAPRWSPDGSKLACIVTSADASFVRIVTLPSLETEELALPGVGVERHDLNWSPSGAFLAYFDGAGNTTDESGIWLLRLEDGEAFRITEGKSKDWSPTWSSADSPLFFTSNREGSADLWAQDLEDEGHPVGQPIRITNGVGMRHASFSRDGKKLAYSQGRRVSNVWRVPIFDDRTATWGDAEQVTFDQAFIETVDVSPDGSWVVISSDRGGNQDLWKVPASGGEMIQMTSDPATDLGPAWSPNGEEIAFYSTRTGQRQQFIVPSEGGAARRLLTSDASDWSERWSPDGQQLAFWSDRSGNFDVWVVDTDGTNARQITTHAGRDMMPVWAPAGDAIIFTSERDGARSLYRMPIDGGEPKSLSAIPASQARWSRDGQTLYCIEFGAASGNIWALSPRTGNERRMTDLERKGGNLGTYGLAVTDSHLYFTWEEDRGDIWVMDVVEGE